jgi:dolichol-phosphate mannosyltransferase
LTPSITIHKPLVIVPTYNEADNVTSLVEKTFAAAPEIDVLFVDDNSRDGTQAIIETLIRRYPNKIHLLRRPGKLGLGTAYLDGFRWAINNGYDAFVEMDADHSHNPKELPTILKLLTKYDAVIGSRYVDGGSTVNWSFIRKCISKFGSFYGRTILGMTVRDLTGGFNGWRKETIAKINPDLVKSEGYSFQIELKYRAFCAGKSLIETPITFDERRAGQSKMSLKIVLEAMYRVWTLKKIKAD